MIATVAIGRYITALIDDSASMKFKQDYLFIQGDEK